MVIESDRRNGVLVEGAVGDGLDQRGLACVLQSDDGDLELFAEEGALDPVQNLIDKAQHR